MQAAEAVVKILESEGITDAFGIPGAGINGVYKYLKSRPVQGGFFVIPFIDKNHIH